jgi:hypothetical protein
MPHHHTTNIIILHKQEEEINTQFGMGKTKEEKKQTNKLVVESLQWEGVRAESGRSAPAEPRIDTGYGYVHFP